MTAIGDAVEATARLANRCQLLESSDDAATFHDDNTSDSLPAAAQIVHRTDRQLGATRSSVR